MSTGSRTARASTACAALLLLAGCGGGDPTSAASGDPSATPSASASVEGSPSATAEPSPTVAAATGPLLEHDEVEARLPEGWRKMKRLVPLADSGEQPGTLSNVTLSARDSFGGSADEIARLSLQSHGGKAEVRRLPDAELGGVPAYHLVGRPGAPSFRYMGFEEFGAVHDDTVVQLILNLDRRQSAQERERARDEILASVVWK